MKKIVKQEVITIYNLESIYNNIIKLINADFYLYQMGKVASTSIENDLKNKFNVVHTHSLYKNYITQDQFKLKHSIKKHDHKFILGELISYFLRKFKEEIKIITLVRDPVARNISMFFQDLHLLLYDEFRSNARKEYNYKNFFESFFHKRINHFYFNEWFDREIRRAFKIDIYNYPFDKEKGYTIIRDNNINILLLKVEKLDKLEKIIRKFTNYDEFNLFSSNSASNKWYSDIYDDFKKNVKFEKKLIDKIYSTRYSNHFYTEAEVNHFKHKWIK